MKTIKKYLAEERTYLELFPFVGGAFLLIGLIGLALEILLR